MVNPELSTGQNPGDSGVQRRRDRERFALFGTHLPGISLRVAPGIDLDILRKTTEKLASLAREYAGRYFRIKELDSEQQTVSGEIKALAQAHEGLRGIQSEEDNFVLNVFPRESVAFDPELLRESLGVAYSSLVHEDYVVSISVPSGLPTETGPVDSQLLNQVLTQALIDLGLKREDLGKIMEKKVIQRVDEKTLEEMIKNGKVSLLEGTRKTETTWAITVAPLKKSPDIQKKDSSQSN